MNFEISVIIPTFNRPQSLHRAIESVRSQTLASVEILVCEDGSTTETEQLINSFNDPKVKWLPGEHAGRPAIPRNRGIRAAQGEWLAFLDDDDVWLAEKLQRQVEAAKTRRCRAVCTNAWRIQNGKNLGLYLIQQDARQSAQRFNFQELIHSNSVISSSAFFHHGLVEKVKGFAESETLLALEDYALWLRIATLTDFAYLSEPLLEYTDEPSQSIRRNGVSAVEQKRRVLQDFSEWAKNERKWFYFFLAWNEKRKLNE